MLVHEKNINQQEKEEQALKTSIESHSTWKEAKAEVAVEKAMIVAINNNNTNTKKINFKEEEEDEKAINQQFKGQNQ